MNIALIGYGKMGKAIENIALQRGHNIVHKIGAGGKEALAGLDPGTVDVAIEFSQPSTAYDNIYQCLSNHIPVISGTTGWLHHKETVDAYCKTQQGTLFYASNFSMGVNMLFRVNAFLAQLMEQYPEYEMAIEEIHQLEKKDAPSGTAITLAQGILDNLSRKERWKLAPTQDAHTLPIVSKRDKDVSITHTVTYASSIDTITIQHTAHSRAGFALGAVLVAEWLPGHSGVLGMDDFLRG